MKVVERRVEEAITLSLLVRMEVFGMSWSSVREGGAKGEGDRRLIVQREHLDAIEREREREEGEKEKEEEEREAGVGEGKHREGGEEERECGAWEGVRV